MRDTPITEIAKGMSQSMRQGTGNGSAGDGSSAGSGGALRNPRMIVPRVCVGLILLMWVLAGFSKVSDMNAFVDYGRVDA